jgi:hypothetical protein
MAVEDEVKAAEEQQDKEMDTETAAQGDESGDKPEAEGKVGRLSSAIMTPSMSLMVVPGSLDGPRW